MENFGMSEAVRAKKEQKRRGEVKEPEDTEDMITIEELNEVLKHAKNRKSCGLDNLPM